MAMNEDAALSLLSTKDTASHHETHESDKIILESELFISLLNGIGLPERHIF